MKLFKWCNTAAFLAVLAVNALANLLPLGGRTTGEVSQQYANLFTPAGYTFAIWGLIYLLLGVFVVYGWGLIGDKAPGTVLGQIGWLFTASCILNILWILSWHGDAIGVSTVCIAALLVCIILIVREIGAEGSTISREICVNAGFSIYYGWLIAAVIANAAVWLTKLGWNGWALSESFWTVAVLVVGTAIGLGVVLIGGNRLAGCAIVWAYIGILVRHLSEKGYAGRYPFVIAAAIIGVVAIASAVTLETLMNKKPNV